MIYFLFSFNFLHQRVREVESVQHCEVYVTSVILLKVIEFKDCHYNDYNATVGEKLKCSTFDAAIHFIYLFFYLTNGKECLTYLQHSCNFTSLELMVSHHLLK